MTGGDVATWILSVARIFRAREAPGGGARFICF